MATVSAHSEGAQVRKRAGVSLDLVSYWLIVAGTYLTAGFLFYYSGKRKLFDQGGIMPSGLAAQFKGSFIASFVGVNVSWLLLGLVLFIVFLGLVASLVAREFLPSRRKRILLGSLGRAERLGERELIPPRRDREVREDKDHSHVADLPVKLQQRVLAKRAATD
jgi:hypothetical protein